MALGKRLAIPAAALAALAFTLLPGCTGGSRQESKSPSGGTPQAEQASPGADEKAEQPASGEQASPAAPAEQAPADQPEEAAAPAGEPPVAVETPVPPPSEEPAGEGGQAMTEADPFAVPDGTPDEIFAFLQGLDDLPPPRDQAGTLDYGKKLGAALVTAGERILAAEATDTQVREAVRIKLAGLSILEQVGEEDVAARREAMRSQLQSRKPDGLVGLLDEELLRRRFQELEFDREAVLNFTEELAAHFEKYPPSPESIRWIMNLMQGVEQLTEPAQAAGFYERFSKAFAASDDEFSADFGKMLAGMARRMNLVGQEMPLEGVTLKGEPLDWSKYQGKVVLVDFWATWCGPCLEEMVNIRAMHEKYHPLGFDVLGISTDEEKGELEKFLAENELPWTVLFDEALAEEGKETMSDRYGVMSIPSLALIGKDGKVVALDPRGEDLGAWLEKLLGGPETPPAAPEATPEPPKTDPDAAQPDAPADGADTGDAGSQ